ncbi:MAG: acyl transferase, partial [Chitinophagales bacterium]
MLTRTDILSKVFDVDEKSFRNVAIELFNYQFQNNAVYHEYCSLLHTDPFRITSIDQIPFLPVEFFKTHRVVTGTVPEKIVFSSSGTTGEQTSRHYVSDLLLYEASFLNCFQHFFGNPENYCILALLPSYLERAGSSLVYMVEKLIEKSGHPKNGFFLYNHDALYKLLTHLEAVKQPALLIGVTFALLDFAETYPLSLKYTKVMETGGMKGRREEITRDALHQKLRNAFSVNSIYSEYGMTELLSQAYLMEDGKFHAPIWMKVLM